MPLSVLQNLNSAAGVGSLACSSTQVGSTLVVCITCNSFFLSFSITDNASGGTNTYTEILACRGNSGHGTTTQMFYCPNAFGGATSIGYSVAPTFGSFFFELSGVTNTPLDQANAFSNRSGGSTVNSPSLTPTQPNSIMIANSAPDGSVTGMHAGNSFVINGPNGAGACAAYLITSSTALYAAIWDQSGTTYGSDAATFLGPVIQANQGYAGAIGVDYQWLGGDE